MDDGILGRLVELRDAAFQEIEGVAGQRVEDVVMGHDILLSPVRRALDHEAAGRGRRSRQLALAHLGFADGEGAVAALASCTELRPGGWARMTRLAGNRARICRTGVVRPLSADISNPASKRISKASYSSFMAIFTSVIFYYY